MQEHNLFSIFTKPFNKLGLKYVVTGAAASIIYGEPRLTNDIDIVIDIENKDIDLLIETFPSPEFYFPPKEIILIEKSRTERGHFNIIHNKTGFKADIYFVGLNKLSKWALDNFKSIEYANEQIRLAPPEYVIIRKLEYYRDGESQKHIIDIESIIRNSSNIIDFKMLSQFIKDMMLEKEWNLVRK